MGVNIASLNIDIRAQTAPFDRDLKLAEKGVKGFASGIGGIKPPGGGLGGMFAGLPALINPATLAIAGLAAGTALAKSAFDSVVGAVSSAMDEIDELSKTAARLQMPTEDLIAFRHAAGLAGVESDAFDKAIERMTRSLGEVAAGDNAKANEAIARIGLDAKALAQQNPGAAFEQIAEAISQIKSPTEQAAAAYAIFGRQGQELLNMLSEGKGGLQAARADMERLNLSISSTDGKAVEAAGDAIARIGLAIKGMAMQFTAGLAPALEQAGISLTDVFSGKADIMRELGEGVGEIILEFLEFAPTIKVAVDGALAFAGALAEVVAVAAKVITAMTDLGNWVKRFYDDVQPPTIEPPKVPEVKAPEIDYSAEAERLKLEEDARKAAEEAAKAEQKRIDDLMKKGEQLTKGLRLPDEIFRDSLSEAKSLLDANAIGIDTYNRAIEEARSKFVDAAMKENEALRDSLNVDVGIANRGTQAGFGAARAGDKALDDMRKKLEEQKAIQQAIADWTEQVANNTKNPPKIQPLKL